MWLFFKEAHECYQTEVIGCGKLYHRYKKDFLNSHSYTDCQYAAGKNEHKKNFYIMEEFLEEREDLVVIFFTKVDFEYHDYKALHHKFNTTEPPPNGQYLHGKPPSILQTARDPKPKQDFQCYFDSTQLNLIARHANEVHLFSADVSEEDMRKLFSCQVSKQLKARSNRRVAFFFDMLCSKNLICKQWQSVIAKHKLILSSSTDKPLTTTKLSSATSDAKSTNASIYEAIRKKVQEIADCGKNDSKDTI